tara:strand:+ start:6460 stop:7734 length:1275 start_codon:yes stop_codon:yes gene_type:complete
MSIDHLYQLFLEHPIVCTDTRKLVPDSIFVALKGGNFNGNLFAIQAIEKGCSYSIVDDPEIAQSNSKCILVNDTLETLQELAHYHRKQLSIPVIAITGSNGKTTSKELIHQVLSKKFNIYSTPGNYNNHIGMPLSILQMTSKTDIAILEMGDSKRGDVTELCTIAEPDFGVLTNIGKDHIEGFGSMEENVLAKKEIIDYLANHGGTFFLNTDDLLVSSLCPDQLSLIKYGSHAITYYQSAPFVEYKDREGTVHGTQLIGKYNIDNIALTYAIGMHFDVPDQQIFDAIDNYIPKLNRSQLDKTAKNELIMDAYNANPSSVELALKSFSELNVNTEKWAIIGDMLELGAISFEEHQNIALLASELKLKHVIFIGSHFYETKHNPDFYYFKEKEEAEHFLDHKKLENATILLKGSRGLQLETLKAYL